MTCSPLQKQLKNLIKSAIIKTNFLGIEVRPSEKKRMCEPACLPVFQCGSCGFVCAFCRHGSEEHYACLRSETGLSFFDFTRAFQKHPDKCRRIDRTSAGVCKAGGGPAPSPQVRRGNCGAHHVGSSAGEYRILESKETSADQK